MAKQSINENSPHSSKDVTKQMDKLQKHKIKISLLLNPNEENHNRLREALNDAYKNIGKQSRNRREVVLQLSQDILKREWERVKSLE